MEIIIQSPHFIINDKLKEFTQAKAEKLLKYDSRILKCEITLKLDKSDTDNNKECEIIINQRRSQFFASRRCSTFEEAINESVRAMIKQLKKKTAKKWNSAEKFTGINAETEIE